MNIRHFINLLILITGTQATAANIELVGTVEQKLAANKSYRFQALSTSAKLSIEPLEKTISLLKVKLSTDAQKSLKTAIDLQRSNLVGNDPFFKPNSDRHVNLGMNNTPVLDQGHHGSCVTFASSGVLDALMNKGDYVSQLCSLSLGSALASKNPKYPSGWNGSWGSIVLNQMFTYGIVSKDDQYSIGCAGVKSYPRTDGNNTGKPMDEKAYSAISQNIDKTYQWQSLLTTSDAFNGQNDSNKLLNQVKNELSNGNRLTFGVLLDINQGRAGAVGTYHTQQDTWMLNAAIEDDAKHNRINAGHEMVIIGFDDDAVVTSSGGEVNHGLLILRNSWGLDAGDYGNYYMTYDYFKAMAMEVQVVNKR